MFSKIDACLTERVAAHTERRLRVWTESADCLNLANNDYLELAQHPQVVSAAQDALDRYGASASASPLITGYTPAHALLEATLKDWFGIPHALIWNSGYAANHALLSQLPSRGDLILADKLIHHSMISGILASGARLIRYAHNDLRHLTDLLEREAPKHSETFVVTESVFSMDGDSPDLRALAALKERKKFIWLVDEAHALGWYGEQGNGLAAAADILPAIDILLGTLGKSLGSQGAFTLCHDERIHRYLLQNAGEFIYSTYLAPAAAAAAEAAIGLLRPLTAQRSQAQGVSRKFRNALTQQGWQTQDGDSPVIPIVLGDTATTLAYADQLEAQGIRVGAIRPPTVPVGSSRLRLSLKLDFNPTRQQKVMNALARDKF